MQTKRIAGKRLSAFRLKRDMSLDDVAYELRRRGVSVQAPSLSRWERDIHTPDANALPALAEIYGCEIDDFYGDGDDEDEESDSPMERAAKGLVSALTAELRKHVDADRERGGVA